MCTRNTCLLLILSLTLVTAILLGACASKPAPPATSKIVLGLDKIPPDAVKWAQQTRSENYVYRKNFGSVDVYVLAAGEKRTGGYSVEIEDWEYDRSKGWAINASLKFPAKGQMVTQALTYPFGVFAVDKGVPVTVRYIDESAKPWGLTVRDG